MRSDGQYCCGFSLPNTTHCHSSSLRMPVHVNVICRSRSIGTGRLYSPGRSTRTYRYVARGKVKMQKRASDQRKKSIRSSKVRPPPLSDRKYPQIQILLIDSIILHSSLARRGIRERNHEARSTSDSGSSAYCRLCALVVGVSIAFIATCVAATVHRPTCMQQRR